MDTLRREGDVRDDEQNTLDDADYPKTSMLKISQQILLQSAFHLLKRETKNEFQFIKSQPVPPNMAHIYLKHLQQSIN